MRYIARFIPSGKIGSLLLAELRRPSERRSVRISAHRRASGRNGASKKLLTCFCCLIALVPRSRAADFPSAQTRLAGLSPPSSLFVSGFAQHVRLPHHLRLCHPGSSSSGRLHGRPQGREPDVSPIVSPPSIQLSSLTPSNTLLCSVIRTSIILVISACYLMYVKLLYRSQWRRGARADAVGLSLTFARQQVGHHLPRSASPSHQ